MRGHQLRKAIESAFDVIKERSNSEEIAIICPLPDCGDQSGNRMVNLKTGKTNCWRCNQGGDVFKWAKYHQLDLDSLSSHAVSTEELLKDLDQNSKRAPSTPLQARIDLPEGFTKLEDGKESYYYKLISDMAKSKNLDISDLEQSGAGFTLDSPLWEPYCIFPVYEYGKLVYYQGRTYTKADVEITKRFPKRDTVPLGAGYWVYNLDGLQSKGARVAIIVESILNVLSLKKALAGLGMGDEYVPVCVFKHSISNPQMLKLLRFSHIEEFCILFDHDATSRAWQVASRRAIMKPSVAEMPPTKGPKTDANDDVYAALEAISNRKLKNTHTSILLDELTLASVPRRHV